MKHPSSFGNLLRQSFEEFAGEDKMLMKGLLANVRSSVLKNTDELMPIVAKLATKPPEKKESWNHYKERINEFLYPTLKAVDRLGIKGAKPLISANAIKISGSPEQIQELAFNPEIECLELDPLVNATCMNDAIEDVDLPGFQVRHPNLTGKGVSVAVLDSGIDESHPFLNVSKSVTTVSESTAIPGTHGTHCAGSIVSRDQVIQGIAPDVTLYNVKVLYANGDGNHTSIVQGIDEALDMEADILSISLGLNHLPLRSPGGHGWMCNNGRCPLCIAVDNAVQLDNTIVVVAAGNEHDKAEALRNRNRGHRFDTELRCPGQAREAISVGALEKQTFASASFSSHGPTSYGTLKPDLAAPGVNITSTVPVPRGANGQPLTDVHRSKLFAPDSGTSMATPIVAGAIALIVENMRAEGTAVTPAAVKAVLYDQGIFSMPQSGEQIWGQGRLSLSDL